MKAKITNVEYGKLWGTGFNQIHYYNVYLEGDDKPFNIGAKKENPDFLQVGKILEYEYKDEAKRSIKRLQANLENKKVQNKPKAPSAPAPESTSLIRRLDDFNESDLIFIDIETVRGVKELKEGTPLYDAWEYKQRYNNELERKSGEKVTLEEYFIDKAALTAVFAKVVTIVVGRIVDNQLSVKRYAVSKAGGWKEETILKEFNDDIIKILSKNPNTAFAGWANFGFDQPFLSKRMMINGIQPNVLLDNAHLKPWELAGIDLKNLWQSSAFYPDSLISVATAFGLPSPKTKMDGSQVGEAYYAGKIDDIVEYCVADVLTSANIYRKLVNKPLLIIK